MLEETFQARRRALGLLARAAANELESPLATYWPALTVRDLRAPEVGLVMPRGRAGGDGAPFNLGEATVARAAAELSTSERGFGHVLGRDLDQARRVAICDALWQREPQAVEARILAPVAARLAAERARVAAETAATRVEFFTLVRGEDAA